MTSVGNAVSPEIAALWKQLRMVPEANRREIGAWLILPSNSPMRIQNRNENIREFASALGSLTAKAKAEIIAEKWQRYLSTKHWQSEKDNSLLSGDTEPAIQWLHAMSRFNLGKCLGVRMIINILA